MRLSADSAWGGDRPTHRRHVAHQATARADQASVDDRCSLDALTQQRPSSQPVRRADRFFSIDAPAAQTLGDLAERIPLLHPQPFLIRVPRTVVQQQLVIGHGMLARESRYSRNTSTANASMGTRLAIRGRCSLTYTLTRDQPTKRSSVFSPPQLRRSDARASNPPTPFGACQCPAGYTLV